MRKLLSITLALLMVVGLAIPAVAAVNVASVQNPGDASATLYTNLNSAAAALKDGGTLTLLANVTSDLKITVPADGSVTVEGNGYTLTGQLLLKATEKDWSSTYDGEATVNNVKVVANAAIALNVTGSLTVTVNDSEITKAGTNKYNVISLGLASRITLNNVILTQSSKKNFISLTGLTTTINSTAFVNNTSNDLQIGTAVTNLNINENRTIRRNSSLTIDFPAQKELAAEKVVASIPADSPEAVWAVASNAIENTVIATATLQSQVPAIKEAASAAIEAVAQAYADELELAKNLATEEIRSTDDVDPLLAADMGILRTAYANIDAATSFTELEEVTSAGIAAVKEAQARELASAKEVAKAYVNTADASDPLNSSASKEAGCQLIDSAATKAEVEEAKSAAVAGVQAAMAQELADAKAAAKAAIDEQNATDPLIDSSAVQAAYEAIDAATTKAQVSSVLAQQLNNVEDAQAEELRQAHIAARQSIHDQNDLDPLTGTDALTEIDLYLSFECVYIPGVVFLHPYDTKAEVAEALSSAIAQVKAMQAAELAVKKNNALAQIIAQNEIDPLIDSTAVNSASIMIDDCTTKAEVDAVIDDALQLVIDAQAAELAAAKEEALEVLSSANAVDPLNDTTVLDDAITAVTEASTKALVKAAKEAGVYNIQTKQAEELADAKAEASSAIANGFNDARIYPENKAALITSQQAAVDGARTKAEVAALLASAQELIKAAEDNDVAAAKQIVIDELNAINDADPITSTAVLSAAIDAVNACDTITGVVSASTGLYNSIREEQAIELAAAKEVAVAALTEEEAKDPLNNKEALSNGIANVNVAGTKALVETAKANAITAIQAAQAAELQNLQNEAIAAVRDYVKNDTNAKVLATAEAEIAKIDATAKKSEVAPAKDAAIDAIIAMRQLVACQEAAEEELNTAAGNAPSDAVKAIVSDGIAAIEAAATPAAVDTALADALNRLYAQRAAEGLEKYCMLQGTEVVDVTTTSDAIYISNAAFSKFVKVMIDSNALSADDFIVVEGSTEVTVKNAYLKTLANGTHTIVIDSGDGIAKFTFTVVGQAPAPATGDATVWFAVVAAVALLGLGITAVMIKKKNEDF